MKKRIHPIEALKEEIGGSWLRYLLSIPLDVITLLFLLLTSDSLAFAYLGDRWGHDVVFILIISGFLFIIYCYALRNTLLFFKKVALVYLTLLSASLAFLPAIYCSLVFSAFVSANIITLFRHKWPFNRAIQMFYYTREPLLIRYHLGDYSKMHFEKSFRQDIGLWPLGTVETLYFGSDILAQIQQAERLWKHQDKMVEFLMASYDGQQHLFRNRPKSEFGSSKGSVQYSYYAIGTLNNIYGARGYTRFNDAASLASNTCEIMSQILHATIPVTQRGIIDLYCCYGLLRNLERNDLLDRVAASDIRNFLNSLFVTAGGEKIAAGYKILPDRESACLSATYFAVKLLKKIGLEDSIEKEYIANFIDLCWDTVEGGFGSLPKSAPTLVHTKMAVSISHYLSIPLQPARRRRIVEFVDACQSDTGFAFRPKLDSNLYASRCALSIVHTLRSLGGETGNLRKFEPGWLGKVLIEQFYDAPRGVFSGYPLPWFMQTLQTEP